MRKQKLRMNLQLFADPNSDQGGEGSQSGGAGSQSGGAGGHSSNLTMKKLQVSSLASRALPKTRY
jgi:hypothetical protein